MSNGLFWVPLGLLASLTFLLNHFYAPVTEIDEEVILHNGYGFVGVVTFMIGICVMTLLALYFIG